MAEEKVIRKVPLNPIQAVDAVILGKNVRYQSEDGLINVRRKSKGIFEFSIVGEKDSAVTASISTVQQSFNRPEYRRGLYVEQELIVRGYN